MKQYKIIIITAVIILFWAGCGFCQEEFETGTITGTVYTNNYFKIRIKLPDQWHVLDHKGKKLVINKGKKMANEQYKSNLDETGIYNNFLLSVFHYPPGTAMKFNSSLMFMVEDIRNNPDITEMDYLQEVQRGLRHVKADYTVTRDIHQKTISGERFAFFETTAKSDKTPVMQRYYAVIRKNHALCFIITYNGKEDLKTLTDVINSIEFRKL